MRTLTSVQAEDIRQAVRHAERRTGLRFAVYVGPHPGRRRPFAERLHAALGEESADAVLVYVDPAGHALEVVTGERARRRLTDDRCRLVALSMATAFSGGDLAGGVVYGLAALAEQSAR
ncbi:TPM domain-containing protein [Streptosporangium soli]|nr:TPM domain-containing protein [Streptosporangium sp. KLBMP 9127]